MEITINTPALLFPAITLIMLAYTNRFLALSARIRALHDEYLGGAKEKHIIGQIKNLRSRINLIRYMQMFSVISFLLCIFCIYAIYKGWLHWAHYIFGVSLVTLFSSLLLSLIEINKSTKALELELSDIEELSESNLFKDIFRREDE
ncbi:DUF2721 domain-containing protein [Ferruginibacter albus]|nr:DUF2721 domain-containing protein [Ferruginibacter albus]